MAKVLLKKGKKLVRPSAGHAGKGGDLSDLQSLWDNRESWTGGGFDPENGRYEGTISNILIAKDKNDDWRVNWTLVFDGDKYEGKEYVDRMRIQNQEGLNSLCGRMDVLGIEVPEELTTESLSEALGAAEGMKVRFRVWHKDEWCNVRFEEPLEDGEPAEEKEGKEDESGGEDESYTKADIKKMSRKQLHEAAKELDLDPKDYADDAELKDTIIAVLDL